MKKITIEWQKYQQQLNNLQLGLEELNISNKYPYLEDIQKQYPKLKIGQIHKNW